MGSTTLANGRRAARNGRRIGRIRTNADLNRAIRIVDALLDRPFLSQAEEKKLEELSDQIEAYETQRQPLPDVPVRDLLGYLMELHGLTVAKLSAATGVSALALRRLLNGTGYLDFADSAKIADHFSLRPGAFVRPLSPQDFTGFPPVVNVYGGHVPVNVTTASTLANSPPEVMTALLD